MIALHRHEDGVITVLRHEDNAMPNNPITAAQLSGQDWREHVHEHVNEPPGPIDRLARTAAQHVSGKYRDPMADQPPEELVADAVNRINDRHLDAASRLLMAQPYVLIRALERAQADPSIAEDDPADTVLRFVQEDAYPAFVEELLDAVVRSGALGSIRDRLAPEGGELDREDLLASLLPQRAGSVDVRRGRTYRWIENALTGEGDARRSEAAAGGPTLADPLRYFASLRRRASGAAGRGRGAMAGAVAGLAAGGGLAAAAAAARRKGGEEPLPGLPPPPPPWDVDCGLDVPDLQATMGSPARGDLLALARTISYLYVFGERQPLFQAMDALRNRVVTSDLLSPVDAGVLREDLVDELCVLRTWIHSWGQDPTSLTVRQRATVAAAIGIRDPASSVPVNVAFARAMDQFVDVLVALAMRRRGKEPGVFIEVARVAAIRLAGSLQGAFTGQTFVYFGFWRRQFGIAASVLAHSVLRRVLGVDGDLDESPAPVIRRLVPNAAFDAASLQEEWAALDDLLDFAEVLLIPETEVTVAEFENAVTAAVTWRVLTGRLDVSALHDTAALTGSSGLVGS